MQMRRGSVSGSSDEQGSGNEASPESNTNRTINGDRRRRRLSSCSFADLTITSSIVFVDLEGYSKTSDAHQRYITRDFMTTLRNLLAFAYNELPSRSKVDDYVILPTGDGAAVCVMKPPRITSASCPRCQSLSLGTIEETALWIGASLLFWASKRNVGLRVGLHSGEVSIVEDPYGDANVCGDAINMAARIMDTAAAGQILASSNSVVKKLNEALEKRMILASSNSAIERLDEALEKRSCTLVRDLWNDCPHCPHVYHDISQEPSEVVVKHGVTTLVQSITCILYPLPDQEDMTAELMRLRRELMDLSAAVKGQAKSFLEDEQSSSQNPFLSETSSQPQQSMGLSKWMSETLTFSSLPSSISIPTKKFAGSTNKLSQLPETVGSHDTPKTKWYMKIKPTEMISDADHIRPKILPQELIRRHRRIAFVGITHDNLFKTFQNVLLDNPMHTWEQVYILYPSDRCLLTLSKNYLQSGKKLILEKKASKESLSSVLSSVVHNLRFLEYDQSMHCGSYWDWTDQGGYIHISPLTWGTNPKTCPAMNYYWNSKDPSPEYRVYRDGLEYLLNIATPFP
ncbi:hypothetical protein HJC23_012621 [Cyclotella cryptica]|uniref:Guanylate cyclase domain-containing protein n=1 Tax=Cyclotella cryptica TaxID=29204 RepID=A0ABD3QP99_9STRA